MTLHINSLHYNPPIKKIIQLQNGRVSGSGTALLVHIDSFCLFKFSGNSDNAIWFNTTIPHDYLFNSPINIYIEYFCDSAGGVVEWECIYNATTSLVDTIGTTLPHVSSPNAGEKIISNVLLTPVNSPISFSSNNNILLLKISRIGSNDLFNGDVYGLAVFLEYYSDHLTNM